MSKMSIKKNLSDQDMFANWQEKTTFETEINDEPEPQKVLKHQAKSQPDFHSSFFTPEIQEKVGKALLDIKMSLYKQGIVDFDIKVSREENKVVLTAVPKKEKITKSIK